MRNILSKITLITLTLLLSLKLYAEEAQIIEFNNKPVVDVLSVLADLNDIKIIPDETVTGNCSYYISTDKVEEALTLFLESKNLYMIEKNNAFSVSKIYCEINKDSDITLKSTDVDIKSILDRLSKTTEFTILYDRLPNNFVTLNITDLKLPTVMEIILKKLPDYTLEVDDNYFYIKQNLTRNSTSGRKDEMTNGIEVNSDGLYSIKLQNVKFSNVVKELFSKAELEYSTLGRNDNIINSIEYRYKTFNELLKLLLEKGNSDYVISNGIYYLFDITQNDISNRHINIKVIELKHITTKELLRVIPGNLMSGNTMKVDDSSNSVVVYGTNLKIDPIIDFIKLVDIENNKKPYLIKLNFVESEMFKKVLESKYSQDSFLNSDKESFLMMLSEDEYKEVQYLQRELDVPEQSNLITLKYIKSEDLIKNLPKSINQDRIKVTPNPSEVLYYGQEDDYNNFIKELKKIDKPVPQIKYKILVLQNILGDNLNFGLDTKAHSEGNGDITLPDGEWRAFSGVLGSLLGLNFNVLSALGPLFSFELNASIDNNKSRILVDTTLQGLSGKEVSLRNTTTSRFYQTTTNSDGETEKTGATQEVSWGIILDIEGWISGDGMITVNVESTLSDETTVSGESSGIPSTSEKIVKTEVRTREGEPIVIGGLLSSKKEVTREKTPLLGDIPFLGYLFSQNVERVTKSEFIIYLLPYIENKQDDDYELLCKRAYKEFL